LTDEFADLSERIAALQREQLDEGLRRNDLDPDPFRQFAAWLKDALHARPGLPNTMTVATASPGGVPSARTVLLKAVDLSGFVFFTNYESRKGRELAANPNAALVFHWPELHRQVNVVGSVERISAEESDEYFRSRPLESRLGAWASRQSSVIPDREELERRMRVADEEFKDGNVPRPPYWGGVRVSPDTIEFWQGRSNRLHDRFRYSRNGLEWAIDRLAP
jgi:pyridoxamine 5'-phosphate oxidase